MERTDNHLLKPAEVVQLLGVSRSWLYEASRSGRIPCVRLGGLDGPVRFETRQLEAWLERSRAPIEPAGREPLGDAREHDETSDRGDPVAGGTAGVTQLRLIPTTDA